MPEIPTSGSQVTAPLTRTTRFQIICGNPVMGAGIAEVEVKVKLPRFTVVAVPLPYAVDLNDAGEVLGSADPYSTFIWIPTEGFEIRGCTDGVTTDCSASYQPKAMNSNRDVIGRIQHLASGQQVSVSPFLWQAGADRAHDYANEPIALIDINDAGQMIGITQLGGPEWMQTSFIMSADGTRVSLGGLNGLGTFAAAISNAGHITGNSWVVAVQEFHAFLWADGVMKDLGALNGSSTKGLGINLSDEVVGYAATSTGLSAFRYADSKFTDLGVLGNVSLGGASSVATSINDAGQIVGWSTYAGSDPQQQCAFLYVYDTMYDLNDMIEPLPMPLSFAMKINNRGQVLAMACVPPTYDDCRYYLLTPVTSP